MRKDHKYLVAMFLAACVEQAFPIPCSTYHNERSSGTLDFYWNLLEPRQSKHMATAISFFLSDFTF